MAGRKDTIKHFESFLAEFLKNNPNLSVEQSNLVGQLEDGLDAIKANKTDLQELFNMESSKIAKDINSPYPRAIKILHRIFAGAGGAAALGALYFLIGFVLGGWNIEAWSTILTVIAGGTGLVAGAGLGTWISTSSKKHFDKKKPWGPIEKRIMKNLDRRNLANLSLSSDINLSLDNIIRGKYKFKEVVTVNKTKNTKNGPVTIEEQIIKFTDQFKYLPFSTKRKLNKLIDDIGDNYEKISLAYSSIISQGIVEVTKKTDKIIDDIEDLIEDTETSLKTTKNELTKEKKTQKGITAAGNSTKERAKKLVDATKQLQKYIKQLETLISIDLSSSQEFVIEDHTKKIEKAITQAKKTMKEARETISDSNDILKEAENTLTLVKETLDKVKEIAKERRTKTKEKPVKVVKEVKPEEDEENIGKDPVPSVPKKR